MTQIELRCWAIEQAVASGAQDVMRLARDILAFAEYVPPAGSVAGPRRRLAGTWTAERVALMTKMRHEGARALAICVAVNHLPGNPVTKTAVQRQISVRNLPNIGNPEQIALMAQARLAKRAA